jgi:3-phenylpropionate/trans-cinnamate dioxygenase ferredoxin component
MSVKVCTESELRSGEALRVLVEGHPVALVVDGSGRPHAIGDTCSHADISLSEGFVEGDRLECWAHGATFDLRTGAALTLPATDPVPVYDVSVVDGEVYVGSRKTGATR